MKLMRYFSLVALAALLGLVGSIGSMSEGAFAQAQGECTVTVQPGESIQQAIDQAAEGAVICLAAGTWEENVRIEKGLTLRGRGAERTVIDGIRENFPVVWIRGPEKAQRISVKLEGLRITGAEGQDCADWEQRLCTSGVTVQGRVRAEISNVSIARNGSDPFGYGLLLTGSAEATISRSTILGNPATIELRDTAQLELVNSTAGGGRFGIELRDAAEATIDETAISGVYWSAVWIDGQANLRVHHSTIAQNGGGIEVAGSARAQVAENVIERNSGCGIAALGSGEAQVEGQGNRMADNGADLCGNLSGGLRLPLAEPTELEILYPDPRYGSLQEAVDALLPGGRLVLQAGDYTPGVAIAKALTLEAAPGARVVLVGNPITWRNAPPVLSLIAGARLRLRGVEIIGGNPGLLLAADAQGIIEDCTITGNWWTGLIARDAARLELIATTVSQNGDAGYGLRLQDSAQARIVDSTITRNDRVGISLVATAQAEILGSTISENHGGLSGRDASQVNLENSRIVGNRSYGLLLIGAAEIQIRDSLISGNENGVLLADSIQALIEGNTIIKNEVYGLALYIRSCGFEGRGEAFLGEVRGGGNRIPAPDEPEGNGRGAVCPEELEFLRTPEGAVTGLSVRAKRTAGRPVERPS
jgi:nitrous oxidase accessory protein NosD